jgi:HSP20 family protein
MAPTSGVPVQQSAKLSRPSHNAFQSLQTEIERLFSDFTQNFSSFRGHALVPSMDVTETDKEIKVTAELPGLEEKDVQVNVADNVLTISGEKKSEREEGAKSKNHWLLERSYGSFFRTLALPQGVKAEDIKADISKGVLTVLVMKPTAVQPKKIEVKAAA